MQYTKHFAKSSHFARRCNACTTPIKMIAAASAPACFDQQRNRVFIARESGRCSQIGCRTARRRSRDVQRTLPSRFDHLHKAAQTARRCDGRSFAIENPRSLSIARETRFLAPSLRAPDRPISLKLNLQKVQHDGLRSFSHK